MGFKWRVITFIGMYSGNQMERVITFIGMYSGNQMENDYLYRYLQWESNGDGYLYRHVQWELNGE